MSTAAQVIDEAIEQLLRGIAEEASRRRAAEESAVEADARLAQMQADCAEAIEQCCRIAEDRIAADRQAAEQRGQLIERTWVLGLIGLILDGLEEGAAAASLRSLRRMVEEGPIEVGVPASELVV